MRWSLLVLFWMIPSSADSQTPQIQKVVIFENGIYRAQSSRPSSHTSTIGPVSALQNIQLLERTTTVPARRLVRFGVRYVVNGSPRRASVELRMITRFPDEGLLDPHSRQRHFMHEYKMPVQIGIPGYRDYHLDEEWEVVPGRWVFEFWIDNRKLGQQEFCLYDPTSPKAAVDCMKLISFKSPPVNRRTLDEAAAGGASAEVN